MYQLPLYELEEEKCPESISDLITICEQYHQKECGTLVRYFEKIDPDWCNTLFLTVFPCIWDLSKHISALFPTGGLERLEAGEKGNVTYTREQIAAVLVHMLVGSTRPDKRIAYWKDFSVWICHDKMTLSDNDPRVAYVESLFRYFHRFSQLSEFQRQEKVCFQRVGVWDCNNRVPQWQTDFEEVEIASDNVTLCLDGRIGDRAGEEIEMDFANKDVGFGLTATQEEILFGMNPEMCIAPLFVATLEEQEALIVTGARSACDYEGYGTRLQCYSRGDDSPMSESRSVLCVDAIDFSENFANTALDILRLQLQSSALERSANKLYAGFSACSQFAQPIASGKWGGGAFGGNATLSVILQILVATVCGKQIRFYLFNDEHVFKQVELFLEKFEGKSVSSIWGLLAKQDESIVKLLQEVCDTGA